MDEKLESKLQKFADEALQEGLKLATYLDTEFKRLGISDPVKMHALASLFAGMLIESEESVSMLEVQEGKLFNDAERVQHFADEVYELAAQGRMQREIDRAAEQGRIISEEDQRGSTRSQGKRTKSH